MLGNVAIQNQLTNLWPGLWLHEYHITRGGVSLLGIAQRSSRYARSRGDTAMSPHKTMYSSLQTALVWAALLALSACHANDKINRNIQPFDLRDVSLGDQTAQVGSCMASCHAACKTLSMSRVLLFLVPIQAHLTQLNAEYLFLLDPDRCVYVVSQYQFVCQSSLCMRWVERVTMKWRTRLD